MKFFLPRPRNSIVYTKRPRSLDERTERKIRRACAMIRVKVLRNIPISFSLKLYNRLKLAGLNSNIWCEIPVAGYLLRWKKESEQEASKHSLTYQALTFLVDVLFPNIEFFTTGHYHFLLRPS